jgi:hypothetical protein
MHYIGRGNWVFSGKTLKYHGNFQGLNQARDFTFFTIWVRYAVFSDFGKVDGYDWSGIRFLFQGYVSYIIVYLYPKHFMCII